MGEQYLPRLPTTEFGGVQPNVAPTVAPSTPASKYGGYENPNAFLEHVTCRLCDAPCNSDRGFWMTACGHVLCDKGHEHKSNTCTFCGKSPISTFVIGGTSPETLQGWFASPASRVAGAASKLSQAVEYVEHIKFQVHYMESKLKKQKKEIGRLNGIINEMEKLVPKYQDAQATIAKLQQEKDDLQNIINRSFDQVQQHREAVFNPSRRVLETLPEGEEDQAGDGPSAAKRQRSAQSPPVHTDPADPQYRPASVATGYAPLAYKPPERRTLSRAASVPGQAANTRELLRNYAYGTQQPPSTPVPREQASFALHTGSSHPMMEGRSLQRSAPFTDSLRVNGETRRDGGTPVYSGRPSGATPLTPMGPPPPRGAALPTTARPAFQGALPRHMQAEMQTRAPSSPNLATRQPEQPVQSR